MFKTMVSLIKDFCFCLISWLILSPTFVLVAPILLIFVLYKSLLNLIVAFIHPGWTPLNAQDIPFAFQQNSAKDGKALDNIGVLLEIEGDVDIRQIREDGIRLLNLRNKWNTGFRYDRLRKVPLRFCGHYYWSDDIPGLDLNELVQERKVERTDLPEFLKSWTDKGYLAGNPLWEVIVYRDNDVYKGKTLFLFKMSHGLGDAETLRSVCVEWLRVSDPDVTSSSGVKVGCSEKKPFTIWDQILLFFRAPYIFLRGMSTMLLHFDYFSKQRKEDSVETARMRIKLSDVKEIRQKFDCKFNDVLLVLVANMLRRYLLDRIPETALPEYTYLVLSFMVPHPDRMLNQATALPIRVPIRCPDTNTKLQFVNQEFNLVNELNAHRLLFLFLKTTYWFPSFFLPKTKDSNSGPCCGVTNVPGVNNSGTVFGSYRLNCGTPIAGMYAKRLGNGFGLISMTLGDTVEILMLGNKALFPTQLDMDSVAENIREEMDAILATVRGYPDILIF